MWRVYKHTGKDQDYVVYKAALNAATNMHFSSVFTREDTSSLPVPDIKFNGSEGER